MDCKTEARQATTTLARGEPARRVPRQAEWEFAGWTWRNSHLISYTILITLGANIFFFINFEKTIEIDRFKFLLDYKMPVKRLNLIIYYLDKFIRSNLTYLILWAISNELTYHLDTSLK